MSKRTTWISAAAVVAGLSIQANRAEASSHREALAILNDPCADNTDLYAWVTPGAHDKMYLIAGYNGLHEPGQGNHQTRLCDDVLYQFHITRGNGVLNDAVTYQIQLSSSRTPTVAVDDLSAPVGGGKELIIQLTGIQQTYRVTKIVNGQSTVIGRQLPVAPPNIGPRTDRLAYGLGTFDTANSADPTQNDVGLYDDAFAKTFINNLGTNGSEGRAWVGTRDDGFYLDEKGIFDVLNITGAGRTTPGEDVFAGFNLNVIALEIPTTKLTADGGPIPHNGTPGNDTLLGVWASASRRKMRVLLANGAQTSSGKWVQVSREGLPLIDAGMIGAQDQPKYLRSKPKFDVANFAAYFLSPIVVRDLEFLGTYAALQVPPETVAQLKTNRVDILDIISLKNYPTAGAHSVPIEPGKVGDVLRVDMAIDSAFPNGRPIPGGAQPNMEQADVSDVLLTVIVSGGAIPIGDGVNYNDKNYLTEFPWLPLPNQGLTGGHGGVTP